MIYWSLLVITTYRVVQKTDTQIYFWDNFGNSAQILTILSWLQAEIYGANMTFFHHHTTIVWPPYLAKQILLLISVLSVLFYWLKMSLDSIKMMCGCSSQVAMLNVSAAILDNSFKTSMPFTDTVINETLWEFLTLDDYRSLQFFHRLELLLVVDSLLNSTPKLMWSFFR